MQADSVDISVKRAARGDVLSPPAVESFAPVARGFEAQIESLAAAAAARLEPASSDAVLASAFSTHQITQFLSAGIGAQLRRLRRGDLPAACPDPDTQAAKLAARFGALRFLHEVYAATQAVLWLAWFDNVEGSAQVPNAERDELLRYGSEFFVLYAHRLTDLVSEVYYREAEQLARSGEQRRFQLVRTLLEGRVPAGSQLDLDLDQHHLGIVAWGEGAEVEARALAEQLDRRLFLVGPLNQAIWAWLSSPRPLSAAQERLLEGFRPSHPSSGLAIGLEGHGAAGFRASHRQALRARTMIRADPPKAIHYADVAVAALAAENPVDARAFVAHELRGIDDDSETSERLRETILAYFAAGHNAASAAAALGVHQQTVANRLRTAEERLGHAVGDRHVELETALRLRAFLDRD